jgi:hypothetical protein
MHNTPIANVAIRVACIGCALVAATGCGLGTQEASDGDSDKTEKVAQTQQGWYSTDPYDQHGRMTFVAARAAGPEGYSYDCTETRTYEAITRTLLYVTYGGVLCDGNVAADATGGDLSFFRSLWGVARAESNNHHFLRVGSEPMDVACGNAVADLYKGTEQALAWRAKGDDYRFQRAIGVVTHAIQDSFAPAHTRRDPGRGTANNGKLLDLCSIHQDVAGACRHPESGIPGSEFFPVSADDADDNLALANDATTATKEYLVAVGKMALGTNPNALAPVIQKWFQCPMLVWLPTVWTL